MPEVLDREEAAAEARGSAILSTHTVDESRPPAKLWDNLEQKWVYLPMNFEGVTFTREGKRIPAMEWYWQKVVHVCGDCGDISVFPANARAHIEQARQRFLDHRTASVSTAFQGEHPVQTCSGCGTVFPSRKHMAQRHIDRILKQGGHQSAEVVVIKRFAQAPGVPEIKRLQTAASGPVASQVEQDAPSRRRKRRRRRR